LDPDATIQSRRKRARVAATVRLALDSDSAVVVVDWWTGRMWSDSPAPMMMTTWCVSMGYTSRWMVRCRLVNTPYTVGIGVLNSTTRCDGVWLGELAWRRKLGIFAKYIYIDMKEVKRGLLIFSPISNECC
jgi:hypothetical protein